MSTCHAKSLDSEVKAPLGWAEMPLLWSLHCVRPPVLNRSTTCDALTSTKHNLKPKKLLKHTGGSPSPARSSTKIKLSMQLDRMAEEWCIQSQGHRMFRLRMAVSNSDESRRDSRLRTCHPLRHWARNMCSYQRSQCTEDESNAIELCCPRAIRGR